MINLAINKAAGNNLKPMLIDVKKAFDSIEHPYLIECIEKFNLPPWIYPFLKSTISRWKVEIRLENKKLLEKEIKRGILQGDSLSPLLFVLCMDPLSPMLNFKHPKIAINARDNEEFASSHLLFIDDLKLLAENKETLEKMSEETDKFFNIVGLERNKAKLATNSNCCEDSAILLDINEGYKWNNRE